MKLNRYTVAGLIYITFIIALAVGDIGNTPSSCDPFEWWIPIAIGGIMAIPFMLGYRGGKE